MSKYESVVFIISVNISYGATATEVQNALNDIPTLSFEAVNGKTLFKFYFFYLNNIVLSSYKCFGK